MRRKSGSHADIPQPFELACAVGEAINVTEDRLDYLTPGEYDVVAHHQKIIVQAGEAELDSRFVVRRVQ